MKASDGMRILKPADLKKLLLFPRYGCWNLCQQLSKVLIGSKLFILALIIPYIKKERPWLIFETGEIQNKFFFQRKTQQNTIWVIRSNCIKLIFLIWNMWCLDLCVCYFMVQYKRNSIMKEWPWKEDCRFQIQMQIVMTMLMEMNLNDFWAFRLTFFFSEYFFMFCPSLMVMVGNRWGQNFRLSLVQ